MSAPAPYFHRTATKVVVVGAGPAGLTAAWRLVQRDLVPTVLEADEAVGGLSRTWRRKGWLLDAGGHRFYTKIDEIEAIWRELLDERDLLRRQRRSAVLVSGRYHTYPLDPWHVVRTMAPLEALRCLASFGWARLRPLTGQDNFEDWACAHFGRRLYTLLYKPYTEKVWGLAATEISADWAAQRLKVPTGPAALLRAALGRPKRPGQSLGELFWYPRYGPGMLWDEMCARIEAQGSKVLRRTTVVRVHHEAGRVVALTAETQRATTVFEADHVISSMPLGALVRALDPAAPATVRRAADALRHRHLLVVALVVPQHVGFPYNWIYIPSPVTRVGRIQNYHRWSPDMVQSGLNALGMEYFVLDGDPLWGLADEDVIQFATREIAALGIVQTSAVRGGYVIRVPLAYPIYDRSYMENVRRIREWLNASVGNLQAVGRNGMHKYNNQDHSMLTAMLAVENILGARHDVWSVNTSADYIEES